MAIRFRSVQLKIIVAVLAVLVVGIAAAITVSTANQKRNLLDAAKNTLTVNTDMLNVTVRNLMLAGEAPVAINTISDLRSLSAFSAFELFRSDGTNAFNDYSTLEFVNRNQTKVQFEKTERDQFARTKALGFQEVLSSNTPYVFLDENAREMDYWFPILNYAECRVCHGEESFIRGVSHFSVSLEGIYGQVRQAGITLSTFLSALGIILFFSILVLMRRLIVSPVLAIGSTAQAVTAGNLDARTNLKTKDELGELAGRINDMISGLKERAELELSSRITETRLEENRKYLDNIKEGLLLLNPDHRVSEQYSAYLEELFGMKDLAGMYFVDLVYPDKNKNSDERKEVDSFLDILFNNRTADMDMIMDINPLSETTLVSADKTILVRTDFLKIFDDEGQTANLMVIFEDLTDIVNAKRELEIERNRREAETERIGAILKAGPAVFEGFVDELDKTLKSLHADINELHDSNKVSAAFRAVHSVKGSSRYLAFSRVETLAHELEDILANLRNKQSDINEKTIGTISELLDKLEDERNGIDSLLEKFRGFSLDSTTAPTTLNNFRDRVDSMVQDIAGELEKKVEFRFESGEKNIPELPLIQSSLLHIIRNAIDHGIEDYYERISVGKSETARLTLRFNRDSKGALVAEVEDDGRGIDLAALERKGVEKGFLSKGKHLPSQIISVIFRPGFSSKEETDSVSGRGVGLDAVRDDMKRLGGQISVKTAIGKGSQFTLILPAGASNEK